MFIAALGVNAELRGVLALVVTARAHIANRLFNLFIHVVRLPTASLFTARAVLHVTNLVVFSLSLARDHIVN